MTARLRPYMACDGCGVTMDASWSIAPPVTKADRAAMVEALSRFGAEAAAAGWRLARTTLCPTCTPPERPPAVRPRELRDELREHVAEERKARGVRISAAEVRARRLVTADRRRAGKAAKKLNRKAP